MRPSHSHPGDSTPDVAVRRASLADVDVAAPLLDAYRQFYGMPSDLAAGRAFLAARLERDESVVLLAFRTAARSTQPRTAAEDGAGPVGFAQLYPSFSSVGLGAIVVLNDLYVVPVCRGQGVARRLVDAAATCATDLGALRLELSTQHTNAPARRLYEALGFVPDTEFTHLSLDLRG